MPRISKATLGVSTAAILSCLLSSASVWAQRTSKVLTVAKKAATENASSVRTAPSPLMKDSAASDAVRLAALEEELRLQSAQLDEMKKMMLEQQETIKLLAAKLTGNDVPPRAEPASASTTSAEVGNTHVTAAQPPAIEDRLKKVEDQLAGINFKGDIRLRSESIFGQSNSLANGDNPAVLGNALTSRHRMRMRARLQMRGSISDEFDWGLRLASGSFADNISTNQTFTDFFNRKPFALDQAFITYKPKRAPGLQLQGGKFEAPWKFERECYSYIECKGEAYNGVKDAMSYKLSTPWSLPEMVFDTDLMVEGFNESYTFALDKQKTPNGKATNRRKELTFVAWQLPFLERNSAFVRNTNGTVNVDQSRRGGRDLALYGGQVRLLLESESQEGKRAPKVALSLSVADHYFSGTQFISPLQVFGNQLQLPLTITIPATATTPAQTVTTQVLIPRDLLVAGNGNLGLTNASNNATNRDGRLASGFNLVDVLARLDLNHSIKYPVTILLNFVTNTRTRDVITAGPGGADLILPNHENKGFWGEVQVGKPKKPGDLAFGYTFMRIEKDAVLTPFNMSDITQQSDMRGHRFTFAYAAHKNVVFSIIGIVTQRLNGLLGPFAATPPGSLDRMTKRLQFDTTLKF